MVEEVGGLCLASHAKSAELVAERPLQVAAKPALLRELHQLALQVAAAVDQVRVSRHTARPWMLPLGPERGRRAPHRAYCASQRQRRSLRNLLRVLLPHIRPIDVELDAVAVRVAQVERLGDGMVDRGVDLDAGRLQLLFGGA